MKKYLITGVSGFVGRHLLNLLSQKYVDLQVCGVGSTFPDAVPTNCDFHFERINLLNLTALERLVRIYAPDYVIHLASASSVKFSWDQPVESFSNNTNIFLNVMESLRKHCPKARVLSVGSSEEYGDVRSVELPITENTPLMPLSPYAVARVAQEMLSKVYVNGYKMDVVMTRSFNHTGPYQPSHFVIPSFVKQIVEASALGGDSLTLKVGDIDLIRDLIDVRDVVEAYDLLLEKGVSGEAYNVCSGEGIRLRDVITLLGSMQQVKVVTQQVPELVRPHDAKAVIGSYKKLYEHTGWQPKISLKKSLEDILKQYSNVGAL